MVPRMGKHVDRFRMRVSVSLAIDSLGWQQTVGCNAQHVVPGLGVSASPFWRPGQRIVESCETLAG